MKEHLLWIYLGGMVLRAILAHGILQNPNVTKGSLDGQLLSCIVWPLAMLKWLFRRE